MQDCRFNSKEPKLLSVDVHLGLEDVALFDLDGLTLGVRSGQCDKSLRLLGLLPFLAIVSRFEVEPRAGGVGEEHIVQNDPEELRELNLDTEDYHEQRIEHAARVEVRDYKALLFQLGDLLLLECLKLRHRKDFVKYCFVDHVVITSTPTALTTTLSSRGSSSGRKRKEQRSRKTSSEKPTSISMLSGAITSLF